MNNSKAKAASFAGEGGFSRAGGEVCEPLLHDNTFWAERQEPMFERLVSYHRQAQVLAAHHLGLAERFASEAEALADILRESERLQ